MFLPWAHPAMQSKTNDVAVQSIFDSWKLLVLGLFENLEAVLRQDYPCEFFRRFY